MSRVEIKNKTKAMLGGKIFATLWLMMVVVEFIFSLPSMIPAIGTLLLVVFSGPWEYGKNIIYFKLARGGNQVDLKDLLAGFQSKELSDLILLGLLRSLFTFLWSLLLIVPGIVKGYAYSMALYIKNDHPDYDWKKCLDESQKMMNGKKMELFVMDLSFIGWLIVGTLCCGIGVLFVAPYWSGARVNFYEAHKETVAA